MAAADLGLGDVTERVGAVAWRVSRTRAGSMPLKPALARIQPLMSTTGSVAVDNAVIQTGRAEGL